MWHTWQNRLFSTPSASSARRLFALTCIYIFLIVTWDWNIVAAFHFFFCLFFFYSIGLIRRSIHISYLVFWVICTPWSLAVDKIDCVPLSITLRLNGLSCCVVLMNKHSVCNDTDKFHCWQFWIADRRTESYCCCCSCYFSFRIPDNHTFATLT